MNFKRIGRILVCLLLICCLTFHAMIPRADATALAPAIPAVVSVVTSPAGLIIGATLLALGIAKGVNPEGFESTCRMAQSALESAGTWINDGMVELLRTEDADGNASYYVDSGLMEDVRSWAYDSGTVSSALSEPLPDYAKRTDTLSSKISEFSSYPYLLISTATSGSVSGYWSLFASSTPFIFYYNSDGTRMLSNSDCSGFLAYMSYTSGQNRYVELSANISNIYTFLGSGYSSSLDSSLDVSLGTLPSQSSDLTDGTSARQWSEDYTDRGLKVYGGGSGNNNNDGKWFWPVVLVAGADLLAMSQADAWAGETPQEFDDYDTKEELKVMDTPEVEFGFGIVLEPDSGDTEDPTQSTEPTTPGGLPDIGGGDNPDTGGDTDGDTGSDTGTESGNQTDYTSWFERIIKGIEELPSKFESWITDCKTAIEELPSKFAEWFNSITEKLSSIWETLKTIPQTILDGLKNILIELFVPQADYLTDKLTSLRERFSFVDSIIDTGKAIGNALITGSAEPPVIYIHLQDTEGSYNIGGTTPFLDMRWYARYKSVGDTLLSSLIWIFFAWRCFVHAPNIISGIAGDVENLNMPDGGGMYLSGSHSPYDGGPFEKVKRGRFERRTKRRG